MNEEILNQESDVSAESSPAPEESKSESSSEGSEKLETSGKETKEKEVPFHEHPRFKELINQRNEFSSKFSESEKTLKALRDELDALKKPKDQDPNEVLFKQLEQANPQFAKLFRQQTDALKELEQMKAWRAQNEQNAYMNAAIAEASKAKTDLKVSDGIHNLLLRSIPAGTPVDKVASIYKELASSIVKEKDEAIREALKGYTKAKKADASIPQNSKGSTSKAPNVATKAKLSKDPEERRMQIGKLVRESMRSESDI